MRRCVRAAAAAVLLGLASVGAASGGRESAERLAPPSVLALGASAPIPHAELDDRRRLVPRGSWGGQHLTKTGEAVELYVSDSYEPDAALSQSWADFLATLVHGDELSRVTVYLASELEIGSFCGRTAIACYSPGDELIVAPADPIDEFTPEAALAHEYGHHVARNRVNPPWSASDYGTKRWASRLNVCAGVERGELFPDDDLHYRLNPGEGFAESYRVLNEQRLGRAQTPWWVVDRRLYPDEATLLALEQDVLRPWVAGTTIRRAARGARSYTVSTPLDGSLTVRLRSSGSFQLTLAAAGKTLATSRSGTVRTTVCGARSVAVRIAGTSTAPFTLEIVRP